MTSSPVSTNRGVKRIGAGMAAVLVVAAGAGWYFWTSGTDAQTASVTSGVTATPVSYPRNGREPEAAPELSASRTEFPVGATAISGPEIVAALSGHTAVLPGGFVEYYAPDGSLHGQAEEKHYGGSWQVRNGTFCTMLQGGDASVCSPVERQGSTLYWSMDGEEEASPISTVPGNPRNPN